MKLAMIARMDNSGLGTLSREFARHLQPDKVMLVANGVYKTFPERYKDFDTRTVGDRPMSKEDIDWLTSDVDVLLFIETPYNWGLIKECRKKNVKTVLYTMYEMTPDPLPLHPDLLLCPSKLDYDVFKDFSTRVKYLPVPVATDKLKWKKREKAHTFIHTGSHGGIRGRKGTTILLRAIEMVKTQDVEFKIFTWNKKDYQTADPRIQVIEKNFDDYWEVWEEGDAMIYPQDYNGICLPIIEAWSSGLGVLTTDIYPFNEYFPKEMLFGHAGEYRTRAGSTLIETDAVRIDPRKIANMIDFWANEDISHISEQGRKWAEENSWDVLLPKYKELLESL